jgi:hypothetical protein
MSELIESICDFRKKSFLDKESYPYDDLPYETKKAY